MNDDTSWVKGSSVANIVRGGESSFHEQILNACTLKCFIACLLKRKNVKRLLGRMVIVASDSVCLVAILQ